MAGEKLVALMQDAAKKGAVDSTDLLYGIVTSISPLKIKVDNRFEIDDNFILLSSLVTETKITIPAHNHSIPTGSSGNALTEITLWRGLIVGDSIRMLRLNKGQLFYVLEREEGLT